MYVVFEEHEIRAKKLWSGASRTTKTPHDHEQSLSFRYEANIAQGCNNRKNYW